MIQENQGFPREGPWRGCGTLLTPGLTPLVIDMESATLVYTSDDLVVGAVEAVHADHTRLLLGVGIVRVGGIEIILKHSQAIQMLDLRWAGRNDTRQGDPPSVPRETPQLPIQTSLLAFPNSFHSGLAPYFTLFSSAGLPCSSDLCSSKSHSEHPSQSISSKSFWNLLTRDGVSFHTPLLWLFSTVW